MTHKVFDWNKAAQRIVETDCQIARAGLSNYWESTGGVIWEHGIVPRDETYVFLSSFKAFPELELDGIVEDCYLEALDAPKEWGTDLSEVYWPDSARKIINGYNG